ncbi:hypothetical protein WA026_011208 [Henosepilachna vigintioctopunctata]|uniref:Uncharacterized protein n=1 Tax=Henosepilachna vigintioctopunctata TaxID=420089 RepID=A0AAW1U5Z9_9CUCU
MMIVGNCILFSCATILLFLSQSHGYRPIRGPPMVETEVYLLDSYIPAAMQVIAYLTENMKYEIKPPSTSTTAKPFGGNTKPTSTHKPAVYAPEKPPGPEGYEKIGDDHDLQKEIQIDAKDFENEMKLTKSTHLVDNIELPENLENMIGERPAEMLKYIHSQTPPKPFEDEDEQVQIFSEALDDSDFPVYLQKNKRKTPPTRAYVTLLSLYDSLSKDAKKQELNKYQGYYDHVLIELSKTSSGTSANQLKFVLQKILTNQDTKQPDVKKKINALLEDLSNEESYLNKAIKDIEPMQFRL